MGLSNMGWSGLILILVALLLVFGPSKLPEIGKAFGRGLREFKDATKGMMEETPSHSQPEQPEPSSVRPAAVQPIELKDETETAKN